MLSDIYQLVHSLSKAEKRYFQLASGLHTIGQKNSYLRLFETLNKQKKFNEGDIQTEFRGQHLYLLKRHLYRSILRSMRSFHEPSSVTIQVYSMINEAELLYKKGLTKAALKLVLHTKKIALRHELHLALAQLLELEIKLLASAHQLERTQAKTGKAFSEMEKQLELYRNFYSCFRFRMDVSATHNREILFRQPEERKKYSAKIKELEGKDLSAKAQWQLYNAAGTFFSASGDHARGHAYHKKAAAVSEKRSSPVSDELRQHLLSVYTQSIADFYLKRYDSALNHLENFRSVFSTLTDSANNKNTEELYLHSLLLEGFIRMDMNDFEKAKPVILQLKKETEERTNIHVSLRNDVYYQQAGFWFCTGDFKEAQSWISKILQDEDGPKENPARYRFGRLIQLVVLFELNEFQQIGNLLPATKKFLKRKGQNFKIEEAVLEFISKYIRSKEFHSKKYKKEKMQELRKKIVRVAKNKQEAASLREFDYLAWINAKISGVTMAEMAG